MADQVKFKITEKNGVELQFEEELSFLPANMPFSDPSYAATDTKAAILETASQSGQSRYVLTSGYESTVQNGRYYEFIRGNSSNLNPFVATENSTITSLSCSVPSSVTSMTTTVYKNGAAVETLVISSNNKATKILVTPIMLMAGDTLSMAKTAGDNPASINFYTHIKVAF